MGIAGNKGGAGIRFRLYETDICFINCHLASGDGQTQKRNEDYQTLESRITFTNEPSHSSKSNIWYAPTPASISGTTVHNFSTSPRW